MIPQPAGIGADLVGEDDAHLLAFPQAAELDLEIDEPEADAEKEAGEEVVDPQREVQDLVDLLRRRPAEGGDVLLRDHRIAELVVLVIELDDRARQRRAFGKAEARRERAGRDVAHDHLERDDLDLAHELLAHVEAPEEVRGDAGLRQPRHQILGDAVVENALAGDHALLLVVEGGRIVLEVLDEGAGLRPFEQDLGLAFINAAAPGHRVISGDET